MDRGPKDFDFQGELDRANLGSAACHAGGWGFGARARSEGNQTICNAHAVMPRCRSNVVRIQRKARRQLASRRNTAAEDSTVTRRRIDPRTADRAITTRSPPEPRVPPALPSGSRLGHRQSNREPGLGGSDCCCWPSGERATGRRLLLAVVDSEASRRRCQNFGSGGIVSSDIASTPDGRVRAFRAFRDCRRRRQDACPRTKAGLARRSWPGSGAPASRRGCRAKGWSVRLVEDDSGMPQNFIAVDREQSFLLPPSLRDWVPEDHLVWTILARLTSWI